MKLFDKPPVLTADDRLRPDSAYPVILHLACESAMTGGEARGSQEAVLVTLAHGVSDHSGVSEFWVRDQDVIITGD